MRACLPTWVCVPVVPQCVEGLVSQSEDSSLALRLVQLQTFFCSHMVGYRESCCAPEPPTEIIMQPQIIQVHTMG